jgi:hypothetical protein
MFGAIVGCLSGRFACVSWLECRNSSWGCDRGEMKGEEVASGCPAAWHGGSRVAQGGAEMERMGWWAGPVRGKSRHQEGNGGAVREKGGSPTQPFRWRSEAETNRLP